MSLKLSTFLQQKSLQFSKDKPLFGLCASIKHVISLSFFNSFAYFVAKTLQTSMKSFSDDNQEHTF